jgi:ABC-type uncharacterized transport system permease subunit
VQDRIVALLRFIGSVSNLSLLIIGGYYYYNSYDKMMEKEMVTGQGYGICIGGCNRLCPAAMGLAWLHCFSCLCRLTTVRCLDSGQITDLLF